MQAQTKPTNVPNVRAQSISHTLTLWHVKIPIRAPLYKDILAHMLIGQERMLLYQAIHTNRVYTVIA